MHVIKPPTEYDFEKAGISGKIFPIKALTEKTHFVLIETETGHEDTIIEHKCDFIYYILEGNGYFEIEGTREDCEPGDLVVIPAGRKFTYKGNLKMLLNTMPPWSEEQEEMIDEDIIN